MILRTSCVFALCTFMGACALQPKSIPPQVSSSGYTNAGIFGFGVSGEA